MLVLIVTALGCAGGDGKVDDTSGPVGDDTGIPPVSSDKDGDGYTDDADCDDNRVSVHPGGTEICNGLDDDCNGEVDEVQDLVLYLDDDGDGFGDADGNGTAGCDAAEGFALNNADCDDDSAAVYPAAPEICDGLDNDCDGGVDDDPDTWTMYWADEDGDGAGDPGSVLYGCDVPADAADNDYDCDDDDITEPVFADARAGSAGSGTLGSPYRSLQSAIDASDRCVIAAAGTYAESIDFHGRNVYVRGLEGSAQTTIRGVSSESAVLFQNGETSLATLEGFTIEGGGGHLVASSYSTRDGTVTYYYYDYYYYGGGIYVSRSSPTLKDVVVRGNDLPEAATVSTDYGTYVVYDTTYSSGGGLYVESGGVTMKDVKFLENYAYDGAAIYAWDSDLDGTRVEISGNKGQYFTVDQQYGDAAFDAFILNANVSDTGYSGYYATYGSLQIENGTLVSNDTAVYNSGADIRIDSSIVTGNTTGLWDLDRGYGSWRISYSDTYQNDTDFSNVDDPTETYGNLQVEPAFVGYTDDTVYDDDDLHLDAGSELRDAGNPGSARRDADGTENDVGAFGGPEGTW